MSETKRIMVVDDDVVLNEMYGERLKEEGFEVVSARSGQEALDLCAKEVPAAMVLDIMMPKMNGLDVLKKLRENEETKNIPVIILTALIQKLEDIKSKLGPHDSYLIKSESTPAQVVDKIKSAVG